MSMFLVVIDVNQFYLAQSIFYDANQSVKYLIISQCVVITTQQPN